METLSKQNRQNRDTTPKSPSGLSDDSLFQSEKFIQPMTQPSASALDESSRDAETFGGMGEATFDARSKHPMQFHNGYYQPTEGAGLPTPYSQPVPEGNPLGRLIPRDSSPIFADTVLSENVRKRFLFAKNQRHIPTPAGSGESSGLSGQNRPTPNTHKRGDFVNYGASAMFKENKRIEDTGKEFSAPVQGPSDGQFQNQNLSYNSPIGFANKYMAPIPSSASTISPSFVEAHRPEGRGVAFKDPIPSHRDRQAPHSHVFMDKDGEGGSKFVAEQLIPLHSFSPEKLVPRYPMDSSASLPQGHPPAKKFSSSPVDFSERGYQQRLQGTTLEAPSIERGGDTTTPHSSNPGVEEFIARQSAKARSRPLYWKTQCHWTMKPLGDPAGNCHYGRSCLYGHEGDVYNDNLSVYYTFENGRSCPNFVAPVTPSPPLGAQSLSSPWVVPEANPQAQALQARENNQVLGDPGASDSRNAPGHYMEGGALVQPDFPWLHQSQQAASSSGQLASPTEASSMSPTEASFSPAEASFTVDESLFRREPRVSVADFILGNYEEEFQSQTFGNLVANMELQYPMSDGSGPDSF
ncbi:hypothetical protein B9Z19DRAFT_1138952 [Tuber borchii]|uniref:Uncharacterized protein n=1 Tax=Tuber borchii TaxID=42251 RepID=A0A2T6Z9J1_TUBBO|nr:hypothetical protein B9Z19DRAFT_1138952 [Tuber borchii]